MLGKLLKYDLKWNYTVLVVFYILAIVFSILGRTLTEIENSFVLNIIGKILSGTAITMIINILINNVVRVWGRFIRNMYKDESYLTHTLPVKKGTIYLSKILSAVISMFTSTVIIIICVAICYYSKENIEALKRVVEFMANEYNSTVVNFIMTIAIVLFLEILFLLFAGYIGIIFGHKSNNLKTAKSVIIGFLAFMIPSIITILILFIIGLFNGDVMELFYTINEFKPSIDAIKFILHCGIVMYVAYILIYYYIGKKQLEKGVNVD